MNDLYIIVDKDNKYITETEDIERAKFKMMHHICPLH